MQGWAVKDCYDTQVEAEDRAGVLAKLNKDRTYIVAKLVKSFHTEAPVVVKEYS
jgi:hypothetical protein